jgi:hypothetical protein
MTRAAAMTPSGAMTWVHILLVASLVTLTRGAGNWNYNLQVKNGSLLCSILLKDLRAKRISITVQLTFPNFLRHEVNQCINV